MQINHIKISNILGIEALELSPKGFTQISGPNGTGKTSVLEAIKGVLTTGHDATLLRHGAEKGEVVLVLDDGLELSKTVTENNSTTAVRRDGKKQPRPGETIKALTDALSVNPIDFLLAKPKERARVLLDAMPLEADADYLTEIVGFQVAAQPGVHALHVIDGVRKLVYDNRTGTNRAVSEKTATISQLEAAVPPAAAGVEGNEDELDSALAAVKAAHDKTNKRIDDKLKQLRDDHAAQVQAKREELQQQIDELKESARLKVEALNAELATQEGLAAAARLKATEKQATDSQPIITQLQIIRNDREAAGRRAQTLDTISTMRTELGALERQAEQQNAALTAIDAYKNDLLSALPIPGVEIRDGEIFRNNTPFDRLNTAQQVDIAVEVAKLRAADLGVVCVDGLELLDSATLDNFKQRALESGLQLFITRVSDQPFTVETSGELDSENQ